MAQRRGCELTSSLYGWKLRPREGKGLAKSHGLKAGARTPGSQAARSGGCSTVPQLCLPPHLEPVRGGFQEAKSQRASWFTDRKGLRGSVKFADPLGGWHAGGSLLPVPILALSRSLPLGKLLPFGAVAGGHPWVLSPQLTLGLLLFNVDTSLHPTAHKAGRQSR